MTIDTKKDKFLSGKVCYPSGMDEVPKRLSAIIKTLKMVKEENLVSRLQTSCFLSVTVLSNFNGKINFANVNSELRYTYVKGESATDP